MYGKSRSSARAVARSGFFGPRNLLGKPGHVRATGENQVYSGPVAMLAASVRYGGGQQNGQ
jgi:hypothetical protein